MTSAATLQHRRRRIALLAMFAVLLNAMLPVAALRAMPALDFFASAICRNGTTQEAPSKPAEKKVCPVCQLVAGQAVALPAGGELAELPPPSLHALPEARAPPALAPRGTPPRAHRARGPPVIA